LIELGFNGTAEQTGIKHRRFQTGGTDGQTAGRKARSTELLADGLGTGTVQDLASNSPHSTTHRVQLNSRQNI